MTDRSYTLIKLWVDNVLAFVTIVSVMLFRLPAPRRRRRKDQNTVY